MPTGVRGSPSARKATKKAASGYQLPDFANSSAPVIKMKRRHLFEWEDFSWFPAPLRDFITDHLVFHARHGFSAILPKLAETLDAARTSHLIDLCSGGGGPVPWLIKPLSRLTRKPVTATLTDLYPNADAFARIEDSNPGIRCRQAPVDAMNIPSELTGLRTMFMALHHFREDEIRGILSDAVSKSSAFAAFELNQRTLPHILFMPLIVLLGSLVMTPFVGRVTPLRLLLTYVIPFAPLSFAWDALASSWRAYRPEELATLAGTVANENYAIDAGQIEAMGYIGKFRVTYLIMLPNPVTAPQLPSS